MFQQTAHKPMMYGFCCRGMPESPDKDLIPYKKGFQQLFQPCILDTLYEPFQFSVHDTNVFSADRQIIRRMIFTLSADTDTLDIHLQIPLKIIHVSMHLYIIQSIVVSDPRIIGLPHLCINGSRLILQNHIFISLPVFGHCCLFMLAEINVKNSVPFF